MNAPGVGGAEVGIDSSDLRLLSGWPVSADRSSRRGTRKSGPIRTGPSEKDSRRLAADIDDAVADAVNTTTPQEPDQAHDTTS